MWLVLQETEIHKMSNGLVKVSGVSGFINWVCLIYWGGGGVGGGGGGRRVGEISWRQKSIALVEGMSTGNTFFFFSQNG